MTLASQLGVLASATTFEDLPSEAVRIAKAAILDTVGVALAGRSEPAVRMLEQTLPRSEATCSIWGTRRRLSALDAALVNATAGHVLDYDDCNNVYGGHPSVPIVAPVLALTEETGASGPDAILAYVVGFEVECRIGRCDGYYQYSRGWHPTTTIGVFGAAAACARLLGLSAEQTATAIAIAASLASGVKANFGTMTKPLQVGQCARNGLFAALLARNGCTANPSALEHTQGYFATFNGAGHYQVIDPGPAWGSPFEVIEPGIAFKQYPCCGSTHPVIDALLRLRTDITMRRATIRRIECAIHELCLRHTNRPDPGPGADAKFSLQYCVARSILDGTVTLADFSPARVFEPRIRELLPLIHVRPYTEAEFPGENYLGALVTVEFDDGTPLTSRVDAPLGATSDNPLPAAILEQKFLNCARQALPPQNAERLYAMGGSLESLASMAPWMALLNPEAA
jgi:2-methylcitrate dehydratase PrpD